MFGLHQFYSRQPGLYILKISHHFLAEFILLPRHVKDSRDIIDSSETVCIETCRLKLMNSVLEWLTLRNLLDRRHHLIFTLLPGLSSRYTAKRFICIKYTDDLRITADTTYRCYRSPTSCKKYCLCYRIQKPESEVSFIGLSASDSDRLPLSVFGYKSETALFLQMSARILKRPYATEIQVREPG